MVVIGIVIVVLLAVVALLTTAHRQAAVGRLSRETRTRDRQADESPTPAVVAAGSTSVETRSEEARARADEARLALAPRSTVPEAIADSGITKWEPVDDEQLGVTRRQFFNRTILAGLGLGVGAFGVASLAFLWPQAGGGFGGKIQVGSLSDIQDALGKKIPYYNATAKTYVVAYPKADVPKAKKIPAYTPPIIAGMEQGYVALYQKCPHLGCRVPWCESSQWFECPCHGSKYNRVGEKQGGPAPRGMDRFPFTISGGSMVADTGTIVLGPPIGTQTTGQAAEGPLCV